MSFENFKTEDSRVALSIDLRNEKKNIVMERLTKYQKQRLTEAFKAICNMNFASTENNHSLCGSFHIKPFNTHWDEKTAKEIVQQIKIYISTWVIWPLEEVTGLKKEDIEQERIDLHNKRYSNEDRNKI